MGQLTPGTLDPATPLLTTQAQPNYAGQSVPGQTWGATPFTGTATSLSFAPYGPFNVAIWGVFSGTVVLNTSFDGGVTWIPVLNSSLTTLSLTQPGWFAITEVEHGQLFQLQCSAFTSGTINYRLSGGGSSSWSGTVSSP